jgi:hypothetical protein
MTAFKGDTIRIGHTRHDRGARRSEVSTCSSQPCAHYGRWGARTARKYSNAVSREPPDRPPATSNLLQRPPTILPPGVRIEVVEGSRYRLTDLGRFAGEGSVFVDSMIRLV